MTMSGQPSHARAFLAMLRTLCTGAMLCLCALAWFAGQAPAAHASGVPWCPYPLPDEHAPTRSAIHLNRSEGPVGTNLTVTASGWRPRTQVAIHFDARDPKTGELYVLIDNFWQGITDDEGRITSPNLTVPLFFCVQDTSATAYNTYKFDNQGGTTAYFVLTSDHG